MFWCFERKKPQVQTGKPDPIQLGESEQVFPEGYRQLAFRRFQAMKVGQGLLAGQHRGHITWYMNKLAEGQATYEKASVEIQRVMEWYVPWYIIGIIHGLEASFDFSKQILNGQPWNKKTTWVPRGLGPWPSWEVSTVDGFEHENTHNPVPTRWDVDTTALFFERWNGMGYWRMGKPSPYLWSYSSVQEIGKYVSDGKYSSSAVSKQVGAMTMLKELDVFDS